MADRYVLLKSEEGKVVMLTLKQSDANKSGVKLNVIKPQISQVTFCIAENLIFWKLHYINPKGKFILSSQEQRQGTSV